MSVDPVLRLLCVCNSEDRFSNSKCVLSIKEG